MLNLGILFASEFVGTMLMVFLGNCAAFNIIGKKTFGSAGGWLMGSLAWGLAVIAATYVSQAIAAYTLPGGGGSLNPAVSVALMLDKETPVNASIGFVYIAGEFAGALVGQLLVDALNNRVIRDLGDRSFAAHSAFPAYPERKALCFFNVAVATAVLILFAVFAFESIPAIPNVAKPVLVGLVIAIIAMAHGGLTGYTNNPARDLMPRLVFVGVHCLLRLEGSSWKAAQWNYAWVPFCAPLVGGLVMGGFLAI